LIEELIMNRKQRRAERKDKGQSPGFMSDAIQGLLNQALQQHQAGKFADAEKNYRQALAIDPENADALHLLGVMAMDLGRNDVAVELINKALALRDDIPFFHNNLGNALKEIGRKEDAAEHYKRALKLKPDYPEALTNLGNIYKDAEDYDRAADFYERALKLKSDIPEVHNNMGTVQKSRGNIDIAITYFKHAIELRPQYAEAHYNLGKCRIDKEQFADAANCFLSAVNLKPDFVDAYLNMARCMEKQNMLDAALACYEKALLLDPASTEARNNMGGVYMAQGRLEDAIASYKQAGFDDNVLLAMIYADSVSPEEIFETARQFGQRRADPLRRHRTFPNTREPDRKLRVGYISPDFRDHSVNYFFEPLLDAHDRDKFEVFGYSNVTRQDDITLRLRNKFDHWREIRKLGDDDAADLIESDKVDILVDLAGHTGDNRLLVLARKPAPVQVAWLGFPATTGMKAMDYRITDACAEPEGMTEHLNVENLWRLPTIFCCYGAPVRNIPVINHPPFEDNGYITFGCFNNFAKVTDRMLASWSEILERVPDSRLILEIQGVESPQFRSEVEDRLQRHGLNPDRFILEPRKRANQFKFYNRLDIALDPFPCNGGTTSFDSLWMGVPFVTLAGKHFVSRMGVTILTNAGLPELIAKDKSEYVKIATALAQDKDRLRKIRYGLRDRIVKSPLMDQQVFAHDMESAYREMWRKWCHEP
jgi:predicted O-linked N-acetylglucosamine transferase (SPINDLY family)